MTEENQDQDQNQDGQTGSGNADGTGQTGTGSGSTDDGKSGPKTYTQDQVEEMIRDRLGKTRKTNAEAKKDLLGDLTEEEAKAVLTAHRERQEADKTEAQKAREAADAERQEAQRLQAEAKAAILRADLTRALTAPAKDADGKALGTVNGDYLETVLALALPIALNAADDEDPVATAVAAVRKSAAPMFSDPQSTEGTGNGSKKPGPGPKRTHGEDGQSGSGTSRAIDGYQTRRAGGSGIDRYRKPRENQGQS